MPGREQKTFVRDELGELKTVQVQTSGSREIMRVLVVVLSASQLGVGGQFITYSHEMSLLPML